MRRSLETQSPCVAHSHCSRNQQPRASDAHLHISVRTAARVDGTDSISNTFRLAIRLTGAQQSVRQRPARKKQQLTSAVHTIVIRSGAGTLLRSIGPSHRRRFCLASLPLGGCMRHVAWILCLLYAVQMFAVPSDIEARSQQWNALISELWEWTLQQEPVYASILGDKRYNDQMASYSEKTILEQQAKNKAFLKRFEAIDAAGLSHEDVLNRQLEIRSLKEDIEETDLKLWQIPVNQMNGIHIWAPQLVTVLSFQTVKDYDDYIARLRHLPRVFEENTADMRKGMANGLMPPKFLLEKVVDQTNGIATQPPDKTPFAQPFNNFPASFSEADKTRLKAAGLAVIKDDVLPAYSKFATFVKDEYVPKGRTEVGVWRSEE